MMLLVTDVIVAHERKEDGIAGIHLSRVSINHRLREVEGVHEAVVPHRPRVTKKPAAQLRSDQSDRSVGILQ